MRRFECEGSSWVVVGPDPDRDAAEQLGWDLWSLSSPSAVLELVSRLPAALEAVLSTDEPASPETLLRTILDTMHEVALCAEWGPSPLDTDPDLKVLLRRIAEGFASQAEPQMAVRFMGRLIGSVETITLQTGHDPSLLAFLLNVAVAVDAPLQGRIDGLFEPDGRALRQLTMTRREGRSPAQAGTFVDAVAARSRAAAAAAAGRIGEARRLFEEARALYGGLGLRVEAAACDRCAAAEARREGDHEAAWSLLTNARGTLGEFGAQRELGLCHMQACVLLLDRDRPHEALSEIEAAVDLFDGIGAWHELEVSAELCSRAAESAGDMGRALTMARFAHLLCEERAASSAGSEPLISPA